MDGISKITVIVPLTVCPLTGETNETTGAVAVGAGVAVGASVAVGFGVGVACRFLAEAGGTQTAIVNANMIADIAHLMKLIFFIALVLACLTSHEHEKTIEIASLDVVRSARAHQVDRRERANARAG